MSDPKQLKRDAPSVDTVGFDATPGTFASAESLPATIEQFEQEIAELHQTMADPAFYKQDGQEIAAQQSRLANLEEQLSAAYARWEELESAV